MSRTKKLSNKVVINGKPVYFRDNADAVEARENSGGSSSSTSSGSGLHPFFDDMWGSNFFYAVANTSGSITQGTTVAMTGSTVEYDGVTYPEVDRSPVVTADGFAFEDTPEEWLSVGNIGFGAIRSQFAPVLVKVYYQGIIPAAVSGITDTPGAAVKPYSDTFDSILVMSDLSIATGANDVVCGYVVRQMINVDGDASGNRAWIRPTLPKYR